MARKNSYDIVTLQTLYQADLAKYQTDADSNSALDMKNGILVGAIIAVGVFVFQDSLFNKYANLNCTLRFVLLLGTLWLVSSLFVAVYAVFPRKGWRYPCNDTNEQPSYLSKKSEDVLLHLISDIESIFSDNTNIVKRKADLFKASLILFVLSSIVLIIIKQTI